MRPGDGNAIEVAQARSTRPFRVLHDVARLHGLDGGDPSASAALADELGHGFGLLDDLADVADDLRRGAVNVLLCRGAADPATASDAADALLRSGGLEAAAATMAGRFARAGALAPEPRFGQLLGFYARDWVR